MRTRDAVLGVLAKAELARETDPVGIEAVHPRRRDDDLVADGGGDDRALRREIETGPGRFELVAVETLDLRERRRPVVERRRRVKDREPLVDPVSRGAP